MLWIFVALVLIHTPVLFLGGKIKKKEIIQDQHSQTRNCITNQNLLINIFSGAKIAWATITKGPVPLPTAFLLVR